jgi:hypothetical protein
MIDIYDYSIQTYEKVILHDYYCQIVTHEVCDVIFTIGKCLEQNQPKNKVDVKLKAQIKFLKYNLKCVRT